jgi:hypothetical protein
VQVIVAIAVALLLAYGLQVSHVLAPSSHSADTTHRPARLTVYRDRHHVKFACSGQLVSKGSNVTFVPHPRPGSEEPHNCLRGRATAVVTRQYDSASGRATGPPVQSFLWERSHRGYVGSGAVLLPGRILESLYARVTTESPQHPN